MLAWPLPLPPVSLVSGVFAATLLASTALSFWLATRQMRHVAAHRGAVPAPFAAQVPLAAHRRAADYTIAKLRFGLPATAFGAAVTLGWTLLGGLGALSAGLDRTLPHTLGPIPRQLALLAAFLAIGGLLELPFSLWSTFRIEQRFGFNRTTWRLWCADALKGLAVSVAIGAPLAALVLWLMSAIGAFWWLAAWAAWAALNLVGMVAWPTLIAPLFNRFEPLSDPALKARVEALMARCGFAARGCFVMDGSRRSAHGNAYFTGLGRAKRVVFFDTLLAKLDADEVEAVLAHELGHHHHGHVPKRIAAALAFGLVAFALIGGLARWSGFYLGLGVEPSLTAPNDAAALILFGLVAPVFAAFLTPLAARFSRHDEFEADAYALEHASGRALASALLKLHEDNASTLTPDPVYARFRYSHPPAAERLSALEPGGRDPAGALQGPTVAAAGGA